MSFSKNIGLQLYVDDVDKELIFWENVGFLILDNSEIMGYKMFTMRNNEQSTVLFTVYDKKFIEKVSPQVVDMKPSILFESNDILKLHKVISSITDTCSEIRNEPFINFNFASPSGIYFAVKGI